MNPEYSSMWQQLLTGFLEDCRGQRGCAEQGITSSVCSVVAQVAFPWLHGLVCSPQAESNPRQVLLRACSTPVRQPQPHRQLERQGQRYHHLNRVEHYVVE